MTTPLGEDPNLPQRLRAQSFIREGEARIARTWFRSLTRFLDRVRPAVLAEGRIDPNRVSDHAGFWTEQVNVEILPEVEGVLATAWRRVTRAGDPPTDPFVQDYLNAAGNRMVRTPDEVYGLIVMEVERGITEGRSLDRVRDEIQLILTATGTPYWRNRAMTVARTETIGAVNAGIFRGAQLEAEQRKDPAPFKQWISTADERTRPTHVAADKQRVLLGSPFIVGGAQLMFPGDPRGPAQEVINCVTGDARISGAGITRAYRSWYSGPAVTLTRSGLVMTVTPNHPVLTESGWVPACEIQVGDHVISSNFGGQLPGTEPDVETPVPTAEEVFDALRVSGDAERVLRSAVNFHGDRPTSDVDVVTAHRPLSFGVNPSLSEVVDQLCLTYAHAPATAGGPEFHLSVTPGDTPCGVVSFADLVGALRGGHCGPLDALGFGLTPFRDSGLPQAPVDDRSTDPVALGECVGGFSALVSLDQIVDVKADSFHGYVYSFETVSGIYISDSTTSHNCRCSILPVVLGEEIDWTNRGNARGN